MSFYKLKFKPLGLFYTPNKGNGNLNTIGKVYRNKPNPREYNHVIFRASSWLGKQNKHQKALAEYFNIANSDLRYLHSKSVKESDWEVVEIQTDEVLKTFLITVTTDDNWEHEYGHYITVAADQEKARKKYESKHKLRIVSILDLTPSLNKDFVIEINQPCIE